jgi:hypothetical protein
MNGKDIQSEQAWQECKGQSKEARQEAKAGREELVMCYVDMSELWSYE